MHSLRKKEAGVARAASSDPVQIGVARAGQVQEERLEGAEFLAVTTAVRPDTREAQADAMEYNASFMVYNALFKECAVCHIDGGLVA